MTLRSFIELLNRGRLVFPSDTVLTVTKKACRLYKEIVKNDKSNYALFGCANPKKAFESVVIRLGEEEETAALVCAQWHRLTDKLLKTMTSALFNAITANYSRDVNSLIHRKKRVIVSAGSTRSQCFDRGMKMTGEKK